MHRLFPLLLFASALIAELRPPLFFREDFKEMPAATPITQEHIARPDVLLALYGPGREGIKKSHHDQPADDPFYVWSGTANGNWLVTLRRRDAAVDLTGQAKVRWRSKQAGYRQLRLVLRLANGAWIVSDASDPASNDWREHEFNIQDLRWRALDIKTIVERKWVEKPDLSNVSEIGWTDLMTGGGSDACSRLDWIEVYGRPVKP
jgi:hypothetical protein